MFMFDHRQAEPTHTDKYTDTGTDRPTDRQTVTDTDTVRQTDVLYRRLQINEIYH